MQQIHGIETLLCLHGMWFVQKCHEAQQQASASYENGMRVPLASPSVFHGWGARIEYIGQILIRNSVHPVFFQQACRTDKGAWKRSDDFSSVCQKRQFMKHLHAHKKALLKVQL